MYIHIYYINFHGILNSKINAMWNLQFWGRLNVGRRRHRVERVGRWGEWYCGAGWPPSVELLLPPLILQHLQYFSSLIYQLPWRDIVNIITKQKSYVIWNECNMESSFQTFEESTGSNFSLSREIRLWVQKIIFNMRTLCNACTT